MANRRFKRMQAAQALLRDPAEVIPVQRLRLILAEVIEELLELEPESAEAPRPPA